MHCSSIFSSDSCTLYSSEHEDAPSPSTCHISTLNLSRRQSSSDIPCPIHSSSSLRLNDDMDGMKKPRVSPPSSHRKWSVSDPIERQNCTFFLYNALDHVTIDASQGMVLAFRISLRLWAVFYVIIVDRMHELRCKYHAHAFLPCCLILFTSARTSFNKNVAFPKLRAKLPLISCSDVRARISFM